MIDSVDEVGETVGMLLRGSFAGRKIEGVA